MTDMFEEIHRTLADDGVFTMMFTHKETEAWDTLTTGLIEAGFTISATHPISTETPDRVQQQGRNSAESTILLTSEKRDERDESASLWDDIRKDTKEAAVERVRSLEEREVDFTKVDLILASFGPTLQVFTENYPVVNSQGEEVRPETALDEARKAVLDYLTEKYLNKEVQDVDQDTRWYLLSWFVFGAKKFPFDEANRLAIGVGTDISTLKDERRMWRKSQDNIILRPHEDRVQDVNKDPDARSGRKPVNPDSLSFSTALDKVHAAMHIYDVRGATEAWNWMNDRNCNSDPAFKATLEALLRVLPQGHGDWELARDLAAGETGDLLDLDLDSEIFNNSEEDEEHQGRLKDF
jgi:adenine-specific DNA methylase